MTLARLLPAAILAIVALLAPASSAQPGVQAEDALPTPDEAFAAHLDAIGGEDRIREVRSRLVRGSIEIRRPSGTTTKGFLIVHAAAPDKSAVIQDFPGVGLSETVYDGEVGWSKRPGSAYTILTGTQLAAAVESSRFYGEADYDEIYSDLRSIGWAQLPWAEKCVVVQGMKSDGTAERLYFNMANGLLELVERFGPERDDGQRERLSQKRHEDWQEFDGLLFPTKVTDQQGKIVLIVKLTEVVLDPEEPHQFERPADVVDLLASSEGG